MAHYLWVHLVPTMGVILAPWNGRADKDKEYELANQRKEENVHVRLARREGCTRSEGGSGLLGQSG